MSHPFDGLPAMKVYSDIIAERVRQDAKWGIQKHDIFKWLSILGEEVGEVHEAALNLDNLRDDVPNEVVLAYVAMLRSELIQVAAVAVEIIEALDKDNAGG